jgi:hypothetical protein
MPDEPHGRPGGKEFMAAKIERQLMNENDPDERIKINGVMVGPSVRQYDGAVIKKWLGSALYDIEGIVADTLNAARQKNIESSGTKNNSAMDAINEYVKEFDLLADSDSKVLAVKGSLLLAKYSNIFKRLLHQ